MNQSTYSTGCFTCNGTGMKVVHRQGDHVPGYGGPYSQTVYASTLYVTCECCIIRSQPLFPTPPAPPFLPIPQLVPWSWPPWPEFEPDVPPPNRT